MSRLDMALERFQAALDSLEQAVAPLASARTTAADAEIRITALSAERERLLSRLAELEEESQAMASATEEVEGRLDGAIAEIRTALGR